MIFIVVLRSNGQQIATGNTAVEAYNNAVSAGYPPQDFQVVPVSQGTRV